MNTYRRAGRVLLGVVLGVAAFSGNASAGSIGVVPDGGCLSYNSSEGTVYFCDADVRPTGTGYIDPFLRVVRDGSSADGTPSTYSSGWNTDAKNTDLSSSQAAANDFDFNNSDALPVANLGYDGVTNSHVVFTVDIDQDTPTSSKPLADVLSLNKFQLYNCSSKSYTSLSSCSGGTAFYNLFNVGDWVNFDPSVHTKTGAGDIDVYIPKGVGFGTQYIALLDGWGCIDPSVSYDNDPFKNKLDCSTTNIDTGLFPDNDGFQEWITAGAPMVTTTHYTHSTSTTTSTPTSTVSTSGVAPEPTVLTLLGAGLVLVGRRLRRRTNQ
ncbi:MAG: hypothetical protein HOP16_15995 [Acidobacteria bacterium]|nr:hypothetical protein [Acidobacteriota bacterium]